MRSLFAIFALGFALSAGAGTNRVSNIAVITNWNKEIITFQRNADGTARINDPSGQLIGTAEAKALQVAADAHQRMTEEADAAAQTAMWRCDEFMATNNTMIIYISAGFGQDLIAMADNYCGWIAKSWYDGELLRDRRKALGLTQKELAEMIGRERSYINRIEKGETDMQLSSFLRIATALGITLRLDVTLG